MLRSRCLLLAAAMLGLAVLCPAQLETAGDYCTDLKASLCDEVNIPVGPVPKKCGAKVCGFTIKTVKKSPCSAEQRNLLSRLLPMCACSAQMADALSRAPSLMQPGQVDAVDRFTGVDDDVFDDVVQAMECLESAGYPSIDVNQVVLRNSLENDLQSVKSLAGIKTYTVIEVEDLEAKDFQAAMDKAQACRDGGPPVTDPTKLMMVPPHCKDFITWYDQHTADASGLLIPMVNEVQRQFHSYLSEVAVNLGNIQADVQRLVSPDAWASFFTAATDEAMTLECDDPTTCYQGVLADPWHELHEMAAGATGSHPALDVAAEALTTVQGFVQETQAAFCDGERKIADNAYRQLSIYRAFWFALNAADYLKLVEHPKILSDILVYMSGLPRVLGLEVPTAVVHDVTHKLSLHVNDAVSSFEARSREALKELADDNYNILATLNGKPPKYCPADHSAPQTCFVDKCNAAVSPMAPPACPVGTRCITDACNGCQAVCAPMPVSSSDAGSAISVMQSWMDLIRKSDDLTKTGSSVKSGLDNLMLSLDYLVSQGSSPGSRNYMYQSGLLTYNEVGKASGSFPCFQGMARMCYSMKGFKKQCVLVPRVGACLVKKTWTMPNEHVPWVAMHSGINDVFYAASDKLQSYFKPEDVVCSSP